MTHCPPTCRQQAAPVRTAAFHLAAVLIAVCSGFTASPVRAQATVRPPSLGAPASPEALQMWQRSAADPSVLFEYLDREALRKALQARGCNVGELGQLALGLWYIAFQRLGDIAPVSLIPRIEQYLAKKVPAKDYDTAIEARLAIERIRLRQQGQQAYVKAMIQWVQAPPPVRPADESKLPPERSFDQQSEEYFRRVMSGARALGVVQAVEAAPVLLAKQQDPVWHGSYLGVYLVHALARLGDARALPLMREHILNFSTYVPPEPDTPGLVAAYWQIRTRGMTQAQAIQDMLYCLAAESPQLWAAQALASMGDAAVPAMLAALAAPAPTGRTDWLHDGIAWALGRMRTREAVAPLVHVLSSEGEAEPVQRTAAWALGEIRDRSARPALEAAASQPQRPLLRSLAVGVLCNLGDPAACRVIWPLAEDPDSNVRYIAAGALGALAPRSSLPRLRDLLAREAEARVQGQIRDAIKRVSARR